MNSKVLFVQVAVIHLLVLGSLFGLMNCCDMKRHKDDGAAPASGPPPLVEPEEVAGRNGAVEAPVKVQEEAKEIVEKEEPLVIEEYGKPGLVKESELPVPEPKGDSGVEHEVVKGETLSGIAQKYGVTLKSVMEANMIKDPGKIQVGQKIKIPGE